MVAGVGVTHGAFRIDLAEHFSISTVVGANHRGPLPGHRMTFAAFELPAALLRGEPMPEFSLVDACSPRALALELYTGVAEVQLPALEVGKQELCLVAGSVEEC